MISDKEQQNNKTSHNVVFIHLCCLKLLAYITLFGMVGFFPLTCRQKGVNEGWMSTIMAVDPLLAIFLQSIISKYTYWIGRRNLIVISQTILGLTCILLMIMDQLDRDWFIVIGIISKLVQGLCLSIIETISIAYATNMYPQSYTTKIGILESMCCVGYSIGPLLFSLAYTAYGYWFPFLITAIVNFIFGITTFYLLPKDKNYSDDQQQSISRYLKDQQMVGYMILIAIMSCTNYYYEPFLSLYLESILTDNLIIISLYFQIQCLGYIIGYLFYNRFGNIISLSISCHLFWITILLIGGLLGFNPNIQLIIGLLVNGFCGGFYYMSIYQLANEYLTTISHGLNEDIRTDITSGLISTAFTIGAFLGPFVFGQITQQVQYKQASVYTTIIIIILCSIFTMNDIIIKCRSSDHNDQRPIHSDDQYNQLSP